MTPFDMFWDLVDSIGWGTRDHFDQAQEYLIECLESWEDEDEDRSFGVSDDGFQDLTAHIVGLGEAEYSKVCKDPRLAVTRASNRDYTESFRYALPQVDYVKTLPKTDLEKFRVLAGKILPDRFLLADMQALVDKNQNTGSGDGSFSELTWPMAASVLKYLRAAEENTFALGSADLNKQVGDLVAEIKALKV